MPKIPKVTIITAVLNGEKHIEQALLSVNSQSYKNIEHIVIDGSSTDRTVEIIEQCNKNSLLVISEPDLGLYDALNKGIRLSTGDIIGFVHSDDFLADDAVIEKIADKFQDHRVEAVYGDLDYVCRNNSSRIVRHWSNGRFHSEKLRRGWMPAHPTLYLRRSVYERIGGFDKTLQISADYELILRYFLRPSGSSAYIPEVLYKMRIGGVSNRGWRSAIKKLREDMVALNRHKVGGIAVLLRKNISKLSQYPRANKILAYHSFAPRRMASQEPDCSSQCQPNE